MEYVTSFNVQLLRITTQNISPFVPNSKNTRIYRVTQYMTEVLNHFIVGIMKYNKPFKPRKRSLVYRYISIHNTKLVYILYIIHIL